MTGLRDRIGLPDRHRGKAAFERLIDGIWVLTGPEVYDRLVRRRGWSHSRYEAWLTQQFGAMLL